MNGQTHFSIAVFGTVVLLLATPVQAYVGPGGAVSALGTILALLAAVAMAVIGFVWFPMRRMLRRRSSANAGNNNPSATGSPQQEPSSQ